MTTDERIRNLMSATPERLARLDEVLSGNVPALPLPNLRLFRMGQAAAQTGLSRCTIWRAVKDGRLRAVEIRKGSFRIPEVELIRFCGGTSHA